MEDIIFYNLNRYLESKLDVNYIRNNIFTPIIIIEISPL